MNHFLRRLPCRIWSPTELAHAWGVSPASLAALRRTQLRPILVAPRRIGYRADHLDTWLATQAAAYADSRTMAVSLGTRDAVVWLETGLDPRQLRDVLGAA
jgi:hypothetical protein